MKSLHNAVVVLALVMCAGAWAQAPGAGGRSSGPPGVDKRSIASKANTGDDARMTGASYVELVNMRVAQLEEDLNLQPGQLPLWNAYRARVVQMLDDVRRGMRVSAAETTAPKRLDGLADTARNRLTAIEDIVDAGKALYGALTPEQKAIADRRLALPLATLMDNAGEPRPR